MAVNGDLRDVSLAHLIQMVCQGGRTFVLQLRRGADNAGVIAFSNGEIIHAEANGQQGETAVYDMLRWPEGEFSLSRNGVHVPGRTVSSNWEHILNEGKRRETGPLPQVDAAAPHIGMPDAEHDHAHEYQLIKFVSRLEKVRTDLTEPRVLKRPLNALDMLVEMVNVTIRFVDRKIRKSGRTVSVKRVLEESSANFPAGRLLTVNEENELSAVMIQQLYRNWNGRRNERRAMFIEVVRCLLRMLKSLFRYLLSFFRTPQLAQQWQEMLQLFLLDLSQIVEKISV